MSSFFTVPGQKKRKRTSAPELPKKRIQGPRGPSAKPLPKSNGPTKTSKRLKQNNDADDDEEISGSDSDEEGNFEGVSDAEEDISESESEDEAQTAAERRLRLAEQYLENVKEHVDEAGFDAADIDRDLIAERLQEDVAETKGRVYRQLASELAFDSAKQIYFRSNTNTLTSIASNGPYIYTTTKDIYVQKWKVQDLPQHQWPSTKPNKRSKKKAKPPPKRKPELVTYIKGDKSKAKDQNYKRHTDTILAVAASADGKYVATGGEDRKIIIYDADSLKPIKTFRHHRDGVTGLVFRRGTNQLYSSSRDRTVKVWSLDEMAYVETLFGHQDHIVDIDALAQERCVSVGSRDRTARLWKVIEETQLVFRGGAMDKKATKLRGVDPRSIQNEGSIDRIAMIDEDLFVTGSDNGSIALWSVSKKKPLHVEPLAHGIDPPLKPTESSAEVHPNLDNIPAPTPRWITALKTIPYSDVILSGSWDGYIRVWKLSEDKKKIESLGTLNELDMSPSNVRGIKGQVNWNQRDTNIKGIVNDIALFERGERGTDGLCVVAVVGKDHRLGRWRTFKARNGGVVFEVPRISKELANGINGASSEAGSD